MTRSAIGTDCSERSRLGKAASPGKGREERSPSDASTGSDLPITSRLTSESKDRLLERSLGQSQDELSRLFGFKDRQTLSAIETGERKVSAEELLRAVQLFGVQLDYFTDPFLLAGAGNFSWRQSGTKPAALADYETDAGRLI